MRRVALALLGAACGAGSGSDSGGSGAGGDGATLQGCVVQAGVDQTVEVGVAATLSAVVTEGEAASWLWDLGDGTVLEGQEVTHRWTEPGVYTAVVQCTAPDGSRATDGVRVNAHPPIAEQPARWSSTLAIADDGSELYVVNREAGTMAILDAETGATEEVEACALPVSVSTAGERVAVSCQGDGTVVWWDRETGASGVHAAPWPALLEGIAAADPEGLRWWVAARDHGALVQVGDGSPRVVEVGPDPFGVAVTPSGLVLATRWRSPETGGEVYRFDPATTAGAEEVQTLTLPVNTDGDSDTTTGGVPNLLEQVVPSPWTTGTVWLPFAHANILRGAWRSGEELVHDATVRAIVSTLDPEGGVETRARKQLDERGRANALAPAPYGDRLYVLHTGTRSVTVLDTGTGDLAGSLLDVGRAPTGLAISPDGETLFVYAWLDREVRAYPVTDLSGLVEPTWVSRTVSTEPLPPAVLTGKQIFWDSADPRITRAGYISCANCHPHGDHDGQTWDFTDRGEGLRNTPPLLGRGGMAMGPVHWSANFDEIQDFEGDLRGASGGLGFLSDADWAATAAPLGAPKAGLSPELDALAAYVSSLTEAAPSPFLPPEGGEAAFAAAGCGDCHPAPLYTDSDLSGFIRHDVGTLTGASGQRLGDGPLDGLDTPTLLGVWADAPYLHDGSAPTLRDAIEAHAGMAGHPDLDLLTAFVRAL